METQSVRVDKKLLIRVKRAIGKSKVPVSAWINTAIEHELKSQVISKRIMKSDDPTVCIRNAANEFVNKM